MSAFDLYPNETAERIASLRPVSAPEPGAFDNFMRGAGMGAMRTFAEFGRVGGMAVGGVLEGVERFGEGHPLQKHRDTTATDWWFRNVQDDIFQNAVDYWTPKPGEVGVAGEMVGQLLATLPLVIASPASAVAATQLGTAETLLRKGVDPMKAGAVGAVQGAGLGLGIWMPILGNNLWQRAVLGGAGFNAVQGIGTRAASGMILDGTAAAEDFKAFDPTAITLDVLLGLAFGGLVHLSPKQRAQGEAAWRRIEAWTKGLKRSDLDAIAVLRQGEHRNVDAAPGKLAGIEDVEAHGQRMRTVQEQLANDRPVQVEDLPAPKFEPDSARAAEAERVFAEMQAEAEALGKAYDIVYAEPMGPAQDPLVRLTPEAIGDVLVERGPVSMAAGSAKLRIPGYGLVKFIWKHGAKSKKQPDVQITRDDVMRTPEVLRNFEPISDVVQADGKRLVEWQVERPDGKKVIYSVRRFADADGEQRLVTLFVNDGSNPGIAKKPLSRAVGGPESPGVAPKASPTGDTGPGSFSYDAPGGQAKGMVSPEAAGVEPLHAEAMRFAADYPDLQIPLGTNPDGTPATKTVRAILEEADGLVAQAKEDANLFQVAAACMLGAS